MSTDEQLKTMVRNKYSQIAAQTKTANQASCCGAGGCSTEVYNIMSDDYSQLDGYQTDADLGLGCGLPTQFAQIKPGDTVIDLGCGAGNDCFVAAHETGTTGQVIGIDFTPAMLEKARSNAQKRGLQHVIFKEGDIENMPLESNIADVVISNCVLNLVPNKQGVFQEIFRVLKPGGHFSISDVVLVGHLPHSLQQAAEMYAGCISGAIQKNDYLHLITANGFTNVTIQKEKIIVLPADILAQYLTTDQIADFQNGTTGIYSITVFAQKPSTACCTPGMGCC